METEPGRDAAIKDAHIRVCLEHDVESKVSTGLEDVTLAGGLPDFSTESIDTTVEFLGVRLSLPLFIAPITGGGSRSTDINRNLATAAEQCRIAMAVGSERPLLEGRVGPESYRVRDWAPTVPILANLGLVHARKGRDYLLEAVGSIGADAVILYVNPLHEILQAGGEGDFRGALGVLEGVLDSFPYPVFLKEVGTGMPEAVVRWASERKIAGVDVAGLGGTNWARIEGLIQGREYAIYETLGTRTKDAIALASGWLREGQRLIAGGGIRTGIDMAKALALGADLTSMALPFLKWAAVSAGRVVDGVGKLREELTVAMWFTGVRTVADLAGKITEGQGAGPFRA